MHHRKAFQRSLWIALCFLLLLVFRPSTAQESKTLHFGEGMIILQLPDRFLTETAISPDGNYVFVTANLLSQRLRDQGLNLFATMHSADQYIWRIYDSSFGSGLIHQRPNWELDIDQTVMEPAAAFSPDGHYLATRSSTQLQIFSVPAWLEIQSHPVEPSLTELHSAGLFHQLQWSGDSRLVATLDVTEAMVWDIVADETYRYTLPLKNHWGSITQIAGSWVIKFNDLEHLAAFAVCSELLEICDQYVHEDTYTVVASPDGQTIFTFGGTICSPDQYLGVWQRENGHYLLDEEANIPPEMIEPLSFNKTGDYLLTSSFPCRSWTVWDFPALSPVLTIPSGTYVLSWLPDDDHIVTYYSSGPDDILGLRLYQVGNDIPLDELELTDFPEIKAMEGQIVVSDVRVQVSANGKRLLVNLGWAALVIPIEYE